MIDSFINNPLAQAIGALAIILSIASFQVKKRSGILIIQCFASLAFSASLIMLGGIVGGILDIISFTRTLVFSLSEKYKWARSKWWLVFYLILIVVVGIITWGDKSSIAPLFAIIGTLLSTVALYVKNENLMRKISLLVGPWWIIYNFIYSSFFGILNELFAITSIIIALIRMREKKSRDITI